MIGGYQIDRSIFEGAPQLLTIFGTTNWRSALELGLTSRNCFGLKMQIVRTSLYRNRKSFKPPGAQSGKSLIGREMHDMQTKSVFAAERDEKFYRRKF